MGATAAPPRLVDRSQRARELPSGPRRADEGPAGARAPLPALPQSTRIEFPLGHPMWMQPPYPASTKSTTSGGSDSATGSPSASGSRGGNGGGSSLEGSGGSGGRTVGGALLRFLQPEYDQRHDDESICRALPSPSAGAAFVAAVSLERDPCTAVGSSYAGHMGVPTLADREVEVLELLARSGEMYALQLVRESKGLLKEGAVYVLLKRMVSKGYLESRTDKHEHLPGLPRRLYRPTGLGEKVYQLHVEFEARGAEVLP